MSDSEESDGEGGLGNVSRVIIRPPGHSGKAKRGHLCFDAAYETGNLGRADLIGEFEYDLFLRPDTCNPHYRFWFNFAVDNVKQDQRVVFNIVNISKNRNLFKDGMTPLVKSSARPKWQRLAKTQVFYFRSSIHQNHYVMSFAFAFDKEDEVYQFALSYPYSYSRLQSYLNVMMSKYPEIFVRESIGVSLQNRKLECITIDQVVKPAKVDYKNIVRVIVIMARSHANESPSSYVIQGFLEFIASNHTIARILRENFVFKILPMLNPDGVFLGNNRCNLIGQDLNRVWHLATEFSHPTIFAAKKMLKELDSSNCYQIDFVIDVHSHTSLLGAFIYGNTYEDVYRYERHLVFPKLLASNSDDFSQDNMMFNADDKKAGTARRFCCERLSDTVNSYSLEISMCGYYLKGTEIMAQYTEEGYMRYGRNLARTFLEYYRFTNVLPVPMVDELRTRRGRPKTHRPRGRSRVRDDIKPRPHTTRSCAPISYTDLAIQYDSNSSNECSPVRHPHYGYGFGMRSKGNIFMNQDQFSLLTIQSSKFQNLDFTNEHVERSRTAAHTAKSSNWRNAETVTVPPKPSLSIIDFNQLTRGTLEMAREKCARSLKSSKL